MDYAPDAPLERARRMLGHGHLTATVSNPARQRHLTFRASPRRSPTTHEPIRGQWWLRTTDDRYVGRLDYRREYDRYVLSFDRSSTLDRGTRYAAGLLVLYLEGNDLSAVNGHAYQLHVADQCGRCGRQLTTPESIQLGLGAECERAVGGRGRRSSRRARVAA